MEQSEFSTQRLDHLGIVAGLCHEIGLSERIDAAVGPSARKVSVGEAVQAMVPNALGFVGRALYLTPEFLHNKPVDLLIRPGLSAEEFNDDSLGRALDELYQAGITEVFAQVTSHALRRYGPDEEEPIPLRVTRGHSKEQRPDLKQVVLSLITTYRSAIPVWLEALSGHNSDKKSFVATLQAYTAQLKESESPYYVVDSALYGKDNLRELAEIRWITRVPETLKEAKQLLRSVAPEEMELLAAYKAQGVSVERGFRFLKDPLFFAEGLFLKRPERLIALLMVMGLALLIYVLAERKVRQALQESGETIPDPKGIPTQRPTLRRIFQVFEGIDVLLLAEGGEVRE